MDPNQQSLVDAIADAAVARLAPQLAQIEALCGTMAMLLKSQPPTRGVRTSGAKASSSAGAKAASSAASDSGRASYSNSRNYTTGRARDEEEFYKRLEAEYPLQFAAALAAETAVDDASAANGKPKRDAAKFRSSVARGVFAAFDDGQKEKMKLEWKAWEQGEEIGQPAATPLTADSDADA